jgi:hypothetical protein
MVWEGARLYIESSQENLSDLSVPSIHERLISMVKAHVNAAAHIVETFERREVDIKEKDLLKGLDAEPVTGINGDLSAPLLSECSAGQLIRGGRNFSQEVG